MTSTAEPRLLLLETSGRVGQVGIARGPRLLHLRRLDEARRHARDLAPAVAELLALERRHILARGARQRFFDSRHTHP